MPSRAQATAPIPEIRWPAKRISPRSGAISPAMMLKRLLLPAPLGPIRPRISPSVTSKLISTLAATLPKDLLISRICSSGSAMIHGLLARAGVKKTYQTLRAGQRKHHDQSAINHKVDAAGGAAEPGDGELLHRNQHRRAEQRPPECADPANYRRERDQHRKRKIKRAFRVDEADILRVKRAADPRRRPADRSCGQFARIDADPKAPRRRDVILHRTPIKPPTRALDHPGDQPHQGGINQHDIVKRQDGSAKLQIPPGLAVERNGNSLRGIDEIPV